MEAEELVGGHKLIARSENGQHLAQLGAAFVAINRLHPYRGWEEEFRGTILDRFEEVRTTYGISEVERIGLRYINKIDIPMAPFRWHDWFRVDLPIPASLRDGSGTFQSHYRCLLSPNLECILNFGSLSTESTGVSPVILDIDVVWRGRLAVGELTRQMDAVHLPHRELFEGYLLDKTRDLFRLS